MCLHTLAHKKLLKITQPERLKFIEKHFVLSQSAIYLLRSVMNVQQRSD
jgi:hypothetical protein